MTFIPPVMPDASEASFYIYTAVICPDCHCPLERMRRKDGSIIVAHIIMANCQYSGKKFAAPMQALKEIVE